MHGSLNENDDYDMSPDEQREQRILDFVNGKMSEEDHRKMEAEINADDSLKKEVSFYQDIAKTTQKMEDDELRRLLSETDQELAGEGFFENEPAVRPRGIFPIWKAVAVAASLALLLIAGWWHGNNNYSNQTLANRYFDAGVLQNMVRSNGGSGSPLSSGMTALSSGNFGEAISFFESIPNTSAQYFEARLYLAIAHYQSGDFKSAANLSDEVSESTSRFRQKARWLRLNALLQLNETGAPFQLLLDEAASDDTDPFYQKKAVELRGDMESFWRKLGDTL